MFLGNIIILLVLQHHGKLKGLQTVKVEQISDHGQIRFEAIKGSEKEFPADIVLLAMGFVGPERGGLLEQLGAELDAAEGDLLAVKATLGEIESGLPNLLHDDVPLGTDEADNKEVMRWGEPREFDFSPRDHVAIGEALGMLDFDAAARISGSRFSVACQGPVSRSTLGWGEVVEIAVEILVY